jgi:hypothetical protein
MPRRKLDRLLARRARHLATAMAKCQMLWRTLGATYAHVREIADMGSLETDTLQGVSGSELCKGASSCTTFSTGTVAR